MSRPLSWSSEYENIDDCVLPDSINGPNPTLKISVDSNVYNLEVLSTDISSWDNTKRHMDCWDNAVVRKMRVKPFCSFSLVYVRSVHTKENTESTISIKFTENEEHTITLIQCIGYDNEYSFLLGADYYVRDLDHYITV